MKFPEKFRIIGNKDEQGTFSIPFEGRNIQAIASNKMEWDHVRVSLPNRCPNWKEMSYIKELFFEPTETAMELHVPRDIHINFHPYCLHLWRPQNINIPLPPYFMM